MTHATLEQSEKVPFVDLVSTHIELEDQLTSVFRSALATAGFVGGRMVEEFEQQFAAYCGTRYCIGVSSGTDALRFALMAVGVTSGDAVITACNTFIATGEAISQAGAQPIFVDVDESTANIDPEKVQQLLETECSVDADGTLRTREHGLRVKAIVPVHLYGQMSDMDSILDLAEQYRLEVVEDACQAHGAQYFSQRVGRWQKAGSIGRAAAFSFYPGKNLGACGEAGAVTTNDEVLALEIRMLRDHGQERKYFHRVEGYNGRLDSIQAGFLSVKLPHLEEWNQQRRTAALWYDEHFSAVSGQVRLFRELPTSRGVHHLYVICVPNRDALREHLASRHIETGIHYPVPLHLQTAYRWLGLNAGHLPAAERLASESLSLPMFPQLRVDQQKRVFEAVVSGLLPKRSFHLAPAS
jgi:dTDP-4-amino-4,6-dideoxygalactose transaminase